MKFKNPDDLVEYANDIGMSAISKISAINYMAATKMGIDGLLTVMNTISAIECNLWTLVPLAMNGDTETFQKIEQNVRESFDNFVGATLALRDIKKDAQDKTQSF
jgi:hypothetical protein